MTESIPLIISFIALGISGVSFYYIHLQGPKIRVEHFTQETIFETIPESIGKKGFPLEKRHTLVVTNNGNQTGLLRDVVVKTVKKISIDELNQSYLKISHGEKYVKTVAPIPIKGKESIVIIFEYLLDLPDVEHYIEVSYDVSFFSKVIHKNKVIWLSN
jgi:hypothetical protein